MPNTDEMIPLGELPSRPLEDIDDLVEMAAVAEAFLASHAWCRSIRCGWLERGLARIVAVFYFEIEPVKADPAVWVIVGDLPPAYMDTESCPTGDSVLPVYIECLTEWVAAIRAGESTEEMMPVFTAQGGAKLPATVETADMLEPRLQMLQSVILPWFEGGRWEESSASGGD